MAHEVVPCRQAFIYGHTLWSHFDGTISKICIFKAFGPLTRCEPNMDQEKWPCVKKWMSWFIKYLSKKGRFEDFFMYDLLPFFFSHNYGICGKKKKKTLLCHGPLTFATRKPPPSLPPQNSFYHDSGWCRLENRPFGDLKFYGHSYNFFLMQTEVFLGWVQQRITYFREARHNFMVHDVNNPLEWEKNPHFLLVVGYWKPSEPQRGSTTCK